MDNYHDTAHGHEFGGLSRVVMVRKTDQRIFASAKNGEVSNFFMPGNDSWNVLNIK